MDDMDEVLQRASLIDLECYTRARLQAAEIEAYLMEHAECHTMTIGLGDKTFELDIVHTEVLNEIYTMLESLKEL